MRDLITVANGLLVLLPKDFEHRNVLIEEIKNLFETGHYRAIETTNNRWLDLEKILNHHLGEPDTDWKNEIRQLMEGTALWALIAKRNGTYPF